MVDTGNGVASEREHYGGPLLKSLIGRLGRALLGTTFIVLGYEAAKEPGGRTALAEEFGVPNPEMAVRANGAAMVLGGSALALGVFPRAAATGLAVSLVPTTLAGHAFWKVDDPVVRNTQRIQVLKNMALAGGLLTIAAAPE